jgi:polar amino acid transport system substrate-binding protein
MTERHRWMWLAAIGLLAVVLTSCGDDGLFRTATPTPQIQLATPTVVPLAPDASTAARIRMRGHLLVGMRYDDEPFGIVDDQGDLVGFDVDLAREFALRWLGDREAVKFVQVTDDSVDERLRAGQVDLVIGTLNPHQSSLRDIAYSAPYFFDGLSLAIRPASAVTDTVVINGPTDLDGSVVGFVEDADTEAPLLRAAGAALPQMVSYPNYYAAMAGLKNGVLGAVVGPRRTLERLTVGSSDFDLTPRFTRNSYVIGVPKNDGPLLDLVNATLMSVISDGTYQGLYGKWFPNAPMPELESRIGTSRFSFGGLQDTLAPPPVTIQDIETRGYMLVGLVDDQLPFGDFDANQVARGFEAELIRALAGRWLGDVTAVQFVRHTEESGIEALKAGQIDLLAARLPHTQRREDEIDFSRTIYQGGIGLLVNAASETRGLTGLNGGTVAVLGGDEAAEVVQRAAAQAGISIAIQPIGSADEALAGVAEGRFDGYADWREELLRLAYANSGFLVLDDRLTSRPIALGLRQNDAAFWDLLDLTLQEMAADGRFAALYDDWFGTDPPYTIEVWPGVPYRPLKIERRPQVVPTPTP